METRRLYPYGSWESPVTSDLIISGTIRLGQVALDGTDVYWDELRPSENGRNALVKWSPDGGTEDITPAGFNVRTRVHEYGGSAFAVYQGDVYFANYVDQRLYRQYPYTEPEPVTPISKYRFADAIMDKARGRLICVREDHRDSDQEAVNSLVAVDLIDDPEGGRLLVAGNDFYASPRLSPDGRRLAWLTWNHPNMPWDGTELWVAELDEAGSITSKKRIAGGRSESIFQPEWSPAGILHFVSDRSGWWNLYRWQDEQAVSLHEMAAEFGLPQWVFGMSTYGFESADTIICTYTQHGRWHLARLDCGSGNLIPIQTPYTSIESLQVGKGFALFIGGAPDSAKVLARLDLSTEKIEVLRRSSSFTLPGDVISAPEAIEFPTSRGQMAHAFFYPPHNPDFMAPADERPPLLVIGHGGPTSATSTTLNLEIQYWTSRGIGVLDVNYRGSTGYGRAYRELLNGGWGIVDVDDCIYGARFLVERGDVDGDRLSIRGSSAGGYTALCAITFHDIFSAAASRYGISEIEALATHTHKFEARYLDNMIGPYPEQQSTYHERSPINYVNQINCPVILLQGMEDKVVPPEQSEMMFMALKEKGVPVASWSSKGSSTASGRQPPGSVRWKQKSTS